MYEYALLYIDTYIIYLYEYNIFMYIRLIATITIGMRMTLDTPLPRSARVELEGCSVTLGKHDWNNFYGTMMAARDVGVRELSIVIKDNTLINKLPQITSSTTTTAATHEASESGHNSDSSRIKRPPIEFACKDAVVEIDLQDRVSPTSTSSQKESLLYTSSDESTSLVTTGGVHVFVYSLDKRPLILQNQVGNIVSNIPVGIGAAIGNNLPSAITSNLPSHLPMMSTRAVPALAAHRYIPYTELISGERLEGFVDMRSTLQAKCHQLFESTHSLDRIDRAGNILLIHIYCT